ncbi:Hypothetical predicted protein [Mytilus galloprovincialis]|uniref:C2H2-type domain-containing protein n=1 Tax=Mytilus galloprovincialis TaxID=29158 RepID=A0A8B6DWS6_MYTGA|nr:Hypothetical predicted protein [Mytilus galloprovincialis]
MDEEELEACRKSDKEWFCPVPNCGRSLSRKQTLQKHLWSCHEIKAGNPSKRYKMYEVSEDVPLPKSTFYHQKSQEERELPEPPAAAEPQQAMPVQDTMESIGDNNDNSPNVIHDTQVDMDIEDEEELVENFVESFGPPLYVLPPSQQVYNAPIPQYHHYMTMCAFATYHSLSDRGFRHLIQLMGLHIPTENLMETNIDTLKQVCGFDTDCLIHHLYCPSCKKLFTGDVENCKTPGCLGKKEKKTANYFVTGSMQAQLKEILERDGIWTAVQDYVSTRSSDHTTISDILDGEEYRKLKEPGGFLADKNNITFSLFTDGIPLFQSSKVSLWPVYMILNELPPKQRFTRKNMVLWGIWQGCGKPQMNMFLRPLVEDLSQLFQRGIEVNIQQTEIRTRAMMIVATMDLQARAYVLQMTQHNGEHGCLYCLEPGKVVKSGKGNCRSYPYRDVDPEPRTKENIKSDAQEAIASGKRVHGINSESVLSCLPYFDVTTNVVIDYMHGILLGILKKLMSLWFDSKNSKEPFYIGKRVDEVDSIIKTIQPPYFLRRLPRKINGNYNHWKASEFRSWLLYFSLPALQNILPDIYLTHYSLLVEGTFILLGEGISEADLRRADLLLRTFVRNLNLLYRDSIVGLNAHNLIHLTRCVRMWGPLWAWSCFVFRSPSMEK